MNKKIIIAGVVVFLLGVSTIAYFSKKSTSTSPQTGLAAGQRQNNEIGTQTSSKSLKDLLSVTGSQQCTFVIDTGAKGTVYVDSGKMRGDFTATSAGTSYTSHMIGDPKAFHIWVEGQTSGYTLPVDDIHKDGDAQSPVDVNEKSNYTCTAWTPDPSVFTLPTNVTFKSMAEFAAPNGVSTSTGSANSCAACDNAPASYQAQCKAALGCK